MHNHQREKAGFHAFLRGIILFGFTMLLLGFIISGNITYYIAPKMMPFIYFAVISFFLLSIAQIWRSTSKGQEDECDCEGDHQLPTANWKKVGIYSIFVLPLIMGFVLPDKVLDSSVAANRGVQLGAGVYSNSNANPAAETSSLGASTAAIKVSDEVNQNQNAVAQEEEDIDYMERIEELMDQKNEDDDIEHFTIEDQYSSEGFFDYYDELVAEILTNDTIIVTDENYLDMMTVLDLYLDEFIGKTIEIKGFTYREPEMAQDELVAARFSMTCCTADSTVYGLLVKGEQTRQFDNDTWIIVTGTIEETLYNDWPIPMVRLNSVQEIDEPDTPYVYPNYY
ncbi:TIGR03943 family putative permease subunit [Bacillus horti]|uniref:Membrane protein n=1 Tax=Caldalkalibacillus horti TaxID=77523 RepID=A0ABT9W4V3_9BACI|nr:TIGR03943 family protein [Bacillus horti]MDQ0168107.1 putative membrane protein [Bacillus horti]